MRLFISYHLADTKAVKKIRMKLDSASIEYFSVEENSDFSGWHHEKISNYLLSKMSNCDILLCIIGKETYSRPHIDYEIHNALKGGVSKRLGIVVVFLESRGDSINNINYENFPYRLADNEDYIICVQNASLIDEIKKACNVALDHRKNRLIEINNNRICLKLRSKYYE